MRMPRSHSSWMRSDEKLTPREAIDQLVEATATPDLSPTERAELREMLSDLVANDPYFGGLANRV